MKNQKNKCLLLIFILYILFVIKVIVFKYSYAQLQEIVNGWKKDVIWEGLSTANFTPLKTIKMYIRYYKLPGIRSFANLFGNVLIFVPFGMLLPMIHKASQNIMVLLANGFLFVLGIEVFQLFSAFGAFDVDDIMLNCLGVLIGDVLYHILTRMFRKY